MSSNPIDGNRGVVASAEGALTNDSKKPIIAKRFKTTLCHTYEKTGRCPYVSRCMFAHGRRELRTPDQNVADGLTTDAAIKEWKDKRAEAIAARKLAAVSQGTTENLSFETRPVATLGSDTDSTRMSPVLAETQQRCESPVKTPPTLPLEGTSTPSSRSPTPHQRINDCELAAASPSPVLRVWRHDPYRATAMLSHQAVWACGLYSCWN